MEIYAYVLSVFLRSWPRWFFLTPDRLVLGALLIVVYLRVAQHLGWYGAIPYKGAAEIRAAVVLALAACCVAVSIVVGRLAHRPVQFSLRSILMAAVAVAVVAGWLAQGIDPASRQRRAVAALREFGALGGGSRNGPPPPCWQVRLFGEDFFTQVKYVSCHRRAISDSALAVLIDCPDIEYLDLTETPISNEGLRHLASVTSLKTLILDGTPITDMGLAHLRNLPRLEKLSLAGTRTSAGWRPLGITGKGLIHLRGMRHLRNLSLANANLTDAGLSQLSDLPSLAELDLGWTDVTDNDLARLPQFPHLQALKLSGTRITDASVQHLGKLTGLAQVSLAGTRVTEAGVAELRSAIPKIEIYWFEAPRE